MTPGVYKLTQSNMVNTAYVLDAVRRTVTITELGLAVFDISFRPSGVAIALGAAFMNLPFLAGLQKEYTGTLTRRYIFGVQDWAVTYANSTTWYVCTLDINGRLYWGGEAALANGTTCRLCGTVSLVGY